MKRLVMAIIVITASTGSCLASSNPKVCSPETEEWIDYLSGRKQTFVARFGRYQAHFQDMVKKNYYDSKSVNRYLSYTQNMLRDLHQNSEHLDRKINQLMIKSHRDNSRKYQACVNKLMEIQDELAQAGESMAQQINDFIFQVATLRSEESVSRVVVDGAREGGQEEILEHRSESINSESTSDR